MYLSFNNPFLPCYQGTTVGIWVQPSFPHIWKITQLMKKGIPLPHGTLPAPETFPVLWKWMIQHQGPVLPDYQQMQDYRRMEGMCWRATLHDCPGLGLCAHWNDFRASADSFESSIDAHERGYEYESYDELDSRDYFEGVYVRPERLQDADPPIPAEIHLAPEDSLLPGRIRGLHIWPESFFHIGSLDSHDDDL